MLESDYTVKIDAMLEINGVAFPIFFSGDEILMRVWEGYLGGEFVVVGDKLVNLSFDIKEGGEGKVFVFAFASGGVAVLIIFEDFILFFFEFAMLKVGDGEIQVLYEKAIQVLIFQRTQILFVLFKHL